MGCSQDKSKFNVEEAYRNQGLPMPDPKMFENNFEKEAFMSINLIRHDPKVFIPMVKQVKSKFS